MTKFIKKPFKSQLFLLFLLSLSLISCSNKEINNNLENQDNIENNENSNNDDNQNNNEGEESDMNINLEVNGYKFVIELLDNETTKEVISMLPLTIEMEDMPHEKYYYFDDTFTTNSERVNYINIGDVMLYGNSCLVIFYESFSTSYSYTRLGKIKDTTNLASVLGSDKVVVNLSK